MNDFFANWYELVYLGNFSNDMFNNNLYVVIGLCMLLIPMVVLTLYYYVVNSVKFYKWYHWLILVAVLALINFLIAYFTSYNNLSYIYEQQNKALPYSADFFSFSLVNMVWTLVVSFIWSMIIKWGSSNCRRSPF